MKNIHQKLVVMVLTLTATLAFIKSETAAASPMTLEHKYQEVFVSAGYATALGAAVGAALLSFKDDPSNNLRYVAIGASVGFFAGTAFGTYLVVAPSFAMKDNDQLGPAEFKATDAKQYQLVVQPPVSTQSWKIKGVETGMVLARF